MTSIARREIVRWRRGEAPASDDDDLACEDPLEIRVDGTAISVTMRTPGDDAELALGFLLSEGLIRSHRDVTHIASAAERDDCNVIDIRLADGIAIDLDRLTRHVFASSSCGICGKATIAAVQQQFAPIASAARVGGDTLLALPERLIAAQHSFLRTGGLHAAGLFDVDGTLIVLREDVGRHNAVDKVLGYALAAGDLPLDRHVLLVSGRTSFEILQKALAGGIAIVAAISAPSRLAVEFAHANGMTLIGFLRGDGMNVYSGAHRVY